MNPEIEQAMWDNDVEKLHELAPCECCCGDHTHEGCPARQWNGCRGSGSMTRDDLKKWADHYQKFYGMTPEQFFGG